jgi:predicted nucleic acid-binding protein
VARIIVLDAGPLWLAASAPGKAVADQCRAWIATLEAGGADVFHPEIADYEVRREFILRGATAGLARLDALKGRLDYREITTAAMVKAAELWALLRRQGVPTAGAQALDADAILAGQALVAGGPGDSVTIATTNLRHLARFPGVTAQLWSAIA